MDVFPRGWLSPNQPRDWLVIDVTAVVVVEASVDMVGFDLTDVDLTPIIVEPVLSAEALFLCFCPSRCSLYV